MLKSLMALIILSIHLPVFAWGHLVYFSSHPVESKALLIYDLLEKEEINYCLNFDSASSFKDSPTINVEVEMALKVWIDAINPKTIIVQSNCSEQLFDLKISFTKGTSDRAKMKLLRQGTHLFGQIDMQEGNHMSSLGELKGFDSVELTQYLENIDISDFDKDYAQYGSKLYWSIHKTLVHEIGHAVGLCDTKAGTRQYCDSEFHSTEHPQAVMRDSLSYTLTDDDLEGVKSLVDRIENI